MAKGIDRIDLYLRWTGDKAYNNTPEESALVTKFQALYEMAEGARDTNELANPQNIEKWRKAYYGTLETLDRQGRPSKTQGRQLRKLVYEFVESKVDNDIPQPHMIAKHKADLQLVKVTEDYLRYNCNTVFNKYLNDRAERACLTDGTVWYKVWWDNTDSTYENSGSVKIDIRLNDQIVPQPGVLDWRELEYIFELEQVSVSKIYDVYGRLVLPVSSDDSQPAHTSADVDMSTVTVVNCYYLNSDRIVGKFSWVKNTLQVICNEEYWQIRKLRRCSTCGEIVPKAEECPICGSKKFKYTVAEQDILDEDLVKTYNPYEAGETTDEDKKDQYVAEPFLSAGTEIPFYVLTQLPFVPRVNISSIESLYGVSEPFLLMEMQDVINKSYTKIVDKTLDSRAILVKNKRQRVSDDTKGIAMIDVNSYDEAESIRVIQAQADTQQDVLAAQMLYESAKSSSGVTDAYQGKFDATALSGRAKEFSASQSAARIESNKVMKAAAFAGIYELMLKFLLAFSDEPRKFVNVLPDGTEQEETWNKYSFLAKTDDGTIYYRDDFHFETDPAATLAGNRVAMWQEIESQFIQGAFGSPADARVLELFWNMMDQQQYPLAKTALAGIKENSQHLPPEVEQVLLQNPEILQNAMSEAQNAGLMGGKPGPEGNGANHATNVERNNERDRAENTTPEERIEENNTNEGNA